ncbi:uncharacterized protein [Amphiura filiformis]|uniref:uncharacterized protein isoform X2 n=1 Tax=Amphiura filiformis TaxID=82378 RepID=UPI003B226B69
MDSTETILLFAILIFDLSPEFMVKAIDITDIRLIGSPVNTPNAGRVQVYEQDQWKDVCHDGDNGSDKDWSIEEAMVACKQLGYLEATKSKKGGFGNGNSDNAIAAFDCHGDESNLSECSSLYGPVDETQCSDNNDAGVICAVPDGYLGCYRDDQQRVLPNAMFDGEMSIKMCTNFCLSRTTTMRYAGVQNGNQCFCGVESSHYARLGMAAAENECDKACRGNPDEICGASWLMSIYDLTLGLSCEQPSLPNGTIIGEVFSFGNWVIFTCESGYELIGDTVLQCVLGDTLNEASWSGNVPNCQKSNYNTCPEDWIASEDFCYLVSDDKLDYEQASSTCSENGATLTSILSNEEQTFHSVLLTVLVKEHAWIGLDDLQTEDNFAWTDGSDISYTNWAPGEPNNQGGIISGGEDCTHLVLAGSSSRKWNDEGCQNTFKYICKKTKEATPTVTTQLTDGAPFSSTEETSYTEKRQASEGAIVGSVVGGVLLLLLIGLVLFFLIKPRLQKQQATSPKDTAVLANALYDKNINGVHLNTPNGHQQDDVIYSDQHQPEYAYVTSTNLTASKPGDVIHSNQRQPEYAYVTSTSLSHQPDKNGTINKNDTEDNSLYYATSDKFPCPSNSQQRTILLIMKDGRTMWHIVLLMAM